MSAWRRQAAIGASVVIGWALASHAAALSSWSFAFGLGSLALAALWVVASTPRRHRIAVALGLAVAAALIARFIRASHDPNMVWLFQHIGVLALFGGMFGGTLLPGRTALITRIATRLHGPLPAEMRDYTRATTIAWTLFFGSMITLSIALFMHASFEAWSIFANLLTPVGVAAMFLCEYAVRRVRLPDFEHASIAQSVRAFSARGAARDADTPHSP